MRDVGSSGRDQRVGQGSPVGTNQLGEIQYLEKNQMEANMNMIGLGYAQVKHSLAR